MEIHCRRIFGIPEHSMDLHVICTRFHDMNESSSWWWRDDDSNNMTMMTHDVVKSANTMWIPCDWVFDDDETLSIWEWSYSLWCIIRTTRMHGIPLSLCEISKEYGTSYINQQHRTQNQEPEAQSTSTPRSP